MDKIISGGFLLIIYSGILVIFKILIEELYKFLKNETDYENIDFLKILEIALYLGFTIIVIGIILL